MGREALAGDSPGRAFSSAPKLLCSGLFVFFFFLYNEVGAYSPCSVGVFPLTAAEQARTAESGPALQTQGFDGSSLILPWDSQFSPPMSE